MEHATESAPLRTEHTDMLHAVQPDYYGKRIATASSDRTVKVFESASGDSWKHTADLKGHEGPVWDVTWAHPKFGVLLASCGYDRKVIVWKELSPNTWDKLFVYNGHELSVNSVSFAPHEFGLMLACASSDSSCSVITCAEGTWDVQKFQAHQIGVNAVSWAPALPPASLLSATAITQPAVKRFASAGCDNLVKIWKFSTAENQWKCDDTLKGHKDWVRDVAWCPSIGLTSSVVASCSQDGTVIIWTQDDPTKPWEPKELPKFNDVVWKLSWSVTGNILAVSGGDDKVTLWKESTDGEGTWKQISSLDEGGNAPSPQPQHSLAL
eukprot:TRINITY_DN2993_c4_g1_i1.p1 TRINITY_DN2993_c4_g1~~TRINITY_DN2993_c4_g1_i1.p1  ORF type:complete len:362 (-),score=31.79 TRINITY_DN2993_c4_g1_i1:118-1089(-)